MAKKERDKVLFGITRRTKTGCGNAYITINYVEGKPAEVFMNLGKSGGCSKAMCEALGKTITVCLQHGAEINEISKMLKGVNCPSPIWEENVQNLSCIDALGKVLELSTKDEIKTKINGGTPKEVKEEKVEDKK